MNVVLEIQDYSPDQGLRIQWEDDGTVEVNIRDGVVHIQANQAGLILLAQHMLTLAQAQVPPGHHLHYDELNVLAAGSAEMIIERS